MSALGELAALEDHGAFIERHVAPTEDEIAAMLRAVGAESLEDLAARTLPAAIAGADLSALPAPSTEAEATAELRELRERNDALEDRAARLRDPREIEQLAREQYGLVRPGEEPYVVLPAPPPPEEKDDDEGRNVLERVWDAVTGIL